VSHYAVEIAGYGCRADNGGEGLSLSRLSRSRTGATRLELTLHDPAIIDRAGLASRVRLMADDTVVFTGRVESQETFNGASGMGKRVVASGPFDWCRFVRVTDDAGIPKLQFAQTTVGAILTELLARHGQTLRQIGSACKDFYDPAQVAALGEPVDHLWIENRDLDAVISNLLSLGDYRLAIDPGTLAWQILLPRQMERCELDVAGGSVHTLLNYRFSSSLTNNCSAVRLVSDRAVSLGYAAAAPAWDTALESQWQLRHAQYASPNADEPNDLAWVFRRFSYAGIEGLLEDFPVELVQKVATAAGGWTYEVIESLPPDRTNRYIVARYPVLAGPASRRVSLRNPLPAGRSASAEVYIRYRYALPTASLCVRYPAQGHAGPVLEAAGLATEEVRYLSDDRQLNESHARRIWREKAELEQRMELSVAGPMITDVFRGGRRLTLRGCADLPSGATFLPDHAEYDFVAGVHRLILRKG